MKRRDFISTGMTLGTALAVSPLFGQDAAGQDAAGPVEKQLRTGIVGCGRHGRAIINACLKIPDLRFAAVCDILPTAKNSAKFYLEAEDIEVSAYADFDEMLDAEKANLDAVIIATPDFVHAKQAVAAMNAGLHVYCESPMATNADDARQMIQAAKSTGKLLQIGYERRSDPRYRHAASKLVSTESRELLLGTITHFETQANRRVHAELIWAERDTLSPDYLAKCGYDSMSEYRNWKQYRKYGCGQCATNFAQQFDVFEWFFGVRPSRLHALGGHDYYTFGDCLDNAAALLTYPCQNGAAKGVIQATGRVWTTTSGGGRLPFEHILGTAGSLQTSTSAEEFRVFAEPGLAQWNEFLRRGDLQKLNVAAEGEDPNLIRVRETGNVVPYILPIERPDSLYRLHVQNFVDAAHGKEPLNCPGELAFPSHVIAWAVDESIEKGVTVDFSEKMFVF